VNNENRIMKNCNKGRIVTVTIKGLCYNVCVLALPCSHYIIIHYAILLDLQRQELGIHNATERIIPWGRSWRAEDGGGESRMFIV
jgi:hypothetical protein